jgi:hypothetical protein
VERSTSLKVVFLPLQKDDPAGLKCACVCARARAHVRPCVRVCVCACVRASVRPSVVRGKGALFKKRIA